MTAPYELTVYSFLNGEGVEQDFTTADAEAARSHAERHRLAVLRNHYEFATSEVIADFTGTSQGVAAHRDQRQALRQRAERVPPQDRTQEDWDAYDDC